MEQKKACAAVYTLGCRVNQYESDAVEEELQALGLDIKILTDNDQEVSIQELSSDEVDTKHMAKEVEEELKDISLDIAYGLH